MDELEWEKITYIDSEHSDIGSSCLSYLSVTRRSLGSKYL